MREKVKEIRSSQVNIADAFWSRMQEKVIDVVIPFQEKVLNDEIPGVEKSHAIENFRIAAGLKTGEFYGMVFQDSDVAKWLEGAAFSLYSTISGMQFDGKQYFYANPLECEPGVSGKLFGYRHALPVRPGWYACACWRHN